MFRSILNRIFLLRNTTKISHMKLPSLSFFVQQSIKTYLRFPVTIIVALIGTIAAIILINHEGVHQDKFLINIALASTLGISLLTTIVLIGEQRKWNAFNKLLAQFIGIGILAGYYFTLPPNIDVAPQIYWIRFSILVAALHLLIAAAPFTGKGEVNGFWHYNKTLFIRILTALLYSGVLFAGLAIALQALEHLFGITISSKRYEELYVVIMGVFNTWFFLGGIPDNLDTLEQQTEYPKGLKERTMC